MYLYSLKELSETRIKIYLFVFFLLHFTTFSQQSTTGPIPPPNVKISFEKACASQIVIKNVPCYLWRHGCGPTALGMVIGYYDNTGYYDLIPGDSYFQTTNVNNVIANSEHYNDYSLPIDRAPNLLPDKSELGSAHSTNCIADFMKTSWSSKKNYYGWSWFNDISDAFIQYVKFVNTNYLIRTLNVRYTSESWEEYKKEITDNCPVVILVDTDGDALTDHFVTGIGYDDIDKKYGVYNTWDRSIHWYEWRGITKGTVWGIYGFTIFKISSSIVPEKYELSQNYPNPFKMQATINYSLSKDCFVSLSVYNMLGMVVQTLVSERKVAGYYKINFNLDTKSSGVYFYELKTDDFKSNNKLIFIK